MARVKVPLFRSPRYVTVDPDATPGAVLGENLTNPDGSRVDLAQAIADAAAGVQSGGGAATGDLTTDEVDEGRFNLYYTDARARAAVGLPAGGLAGQALVKASDADGDMAWQPQQISWDSTNW